MWATIAIVVVLVIVVGLVLWAVGVYNKLIRLRNRFQNAFSQIDVQLKRRHDLIPNLVETAKGYMTHERETLEAVIQARAAATQAQINVGGDPTNTAALKQLGAAEGQLGGALGRLLVAVEQYPELKANENMMALQEELTTTENKVAFSRQAYNDAVNQYEDTRESFPNVVVANMLGFDEAAYFEIEQPSDREVPQVDFSAQS